MEKRAKYRIELGAADALEAQVDVPGWGHPIVARVVSLSVAGCGIEIGDPDVALPRQRSVLVRVALPGEPETLPFWATLCYSRPRGGASYHGMQFTPGFSPAADTERDDRLRSFVMRCLRVELERRTRRSA